MTEFQWTVVIILILVFGPFIIMKVTGEWDDPNNNDQGGGF